jgi:hypothetical protein
MITNEVARMRLFKDIIDEGPAMVLILSADVHFRVLYSNCAFIRTLHVSTASLLGRSWWTIVHPEDKASLVPALSGLLLAPMSASSTKALRCRIQPDISLPYRSVEVRFVNGSQGILCFLWESVLWPQLQP